ncbi:hypothetical protein CVS40_0728 [Lucilia cuprina]|nr:hypothetical protein CVS40_0728 [Lucilia cuprina]
MANYKIISTSENVKWPAYVSTVILEGEQLEKAEKVLEKCLVTLEAYGGSNLNIALLKSAKRTGIFLYEIMLNVAQIREYQIMILNEPWMKANSIATATFEFISNDDGCGTERLVMKRKKSLRYYKYDEMIYEEQKTIIAKGEEERARIELETDV